LEEKPEEKRPLGTPQYRVDDTIKMDLKEWNGEGMDWTHLAHDRDKWWALVNTVMKLGVPQNARNFLTSWVSS
jgi:hypothetical protein